MTDLPKDDFEAMLASPVTPAAERKQPPASYAQRQQFTEGCTKCGGTGSFISYSGRNLGPCFACKGAGKKTFATSRDTRVKAAAKRAEKADAKAVEAAAWRETNKDVIAWLTQSANRNAERGGSFTFPQSLLDALSQYGTLTDNQLAAAQRLMVKDAERKAQWNAEREAAAPCADVSKLDAAFAVARERAQRTGQMGVFVKPLSLKSGEVSVSIQPGKPGSKWDGYLFVRDSNNDERKLGYFKGGKYHASREASPVEQAAVLEAATNPFEAVKAYAKAWSRCGVCGQTLLNDVSIEAGMGPVCRGKFGW